MTKTQKESLAVAGILVGLLLLFWLLHRGTNNGGASGDTAGTTDGTSDQAPYYLTFNQPSPGQSNYGAPYFGPITFNTGCGCDQNGNNVTPQQIAANTGTNQALDSAIIPGYITNLLQLE